jgi:hypothetical protein
MLALGGDGSARSALKERLLAHPNLRLYEPLLKAASVEFAVDLALLKAVAAESGFDPDAVSPKGTRNASAADAGEQVELPEQAKLMKLAESAKVEGCGAKTAAR